ncbi:ferredoxin [Saccharopolyspora sp. K220]|uniref:ferredoxin n=1 Tax=Saccharopolyspora soli TaxID=2926618 RepID=UPI001F5A7EFC|nr:ferredoxin [Saccharopolyspora soli]MCI2418395.1 ferredoxin [Saccharopolyspora soli]
MPHIQSDVTKCQGYANCVALDSEHFDLDDDGLVVVLREAVEDDERETVNAAVRSCPVNAIWVSEG